MEIRFCKFANANSLIRWEGELLLVSITDVNERAPTTILESLAYILISKLLRRPVPKEYTERYRRHLNRKEMRRSLHLVRQSRGRKFVSGGKGSHYDLDLRETQRLQPSNGRAISPWK